MNWRQKNRAASQCSMDSFSVLNYRSNLLNKYLLSYWVPNALWNTETRKGVGQDLKSHGAQWLRQRLGKASQHGIQGQRLGRASQHGMRVISKPHSRDVSEWASRGELVKEMPKLRPEGQEGASQTMAQKRKFQAEKGQGSLDRLWKESFAFL